MQGVYARPLVARFVVATLLNFQSKVLTRLKSLNRILKGVATVTATLIILAIVVVTALAFDFTNGFHDTANAMATSIATGALKPFTAVAISAALNLIGAFLSVHVAATVAKGIVNLDSYDLSVGADGEALLMVVFTGLIGGIFWNLFTWLLGMPSSSSHALFGGLIGAAFAALGTGGVAWSSIAKQDHHPGYRLAFHRSHGFRLRYRLGLLGHQHHSGARKERTLPPRPDCHRLPGFPGTRRWRRPEDHGCHLPRPRCSR